MSAVAKALKKERQKLTTAKEGKDEMKAYIMALFKFGKEKAEVAATEAEGVANMLKKPIPKKLKSILKTISPEIDAVAAE